jgi:uncharacterized protein YegJ (DUF2314 family)
MIGRTILSATLAVLAAGTALAQQPAPGSDPIINYESNDDAMNAAIAEARAHLGYFWEHEKAKARNESDFTLKVGLRTTSPGGPTHEHIWVDGITRSGTGLSANLANEPGWLAGKHAGDRITFTEGMISDWGFYRGEKMIGFYTVRVMLSDLPAAEAAEIRSLLGENPK